MQRCTGSRALVRLVFDHEQLWRHLLVGSAMESARSARTTALANQVQISSEEEQGKAQRL